jgi:hypothetical protein
MSLTIVLERVVTTARASVTVRVAPEQALVQTLPLSLASSIAFNAPGRPSPLPHLCLVLLRFSQPYFSLSPWDEIG